MSDDIPHWAQVQRTSEIVKPPRNGTIIYDTRNLQSNECIINKETYTSGGAGPWYEFDSGPTTTTKYTIRGRTDDDYGYKIEKKFNTLKHEFLKKIGSEPNFVLNDAQVKEFKRKLKTNFEVIINDGKTKLKKTLEIYLNEINELNKQISEIQSGLELDNKTLNDQLTNYRTQLVEKENDFVTKENDYKKLLEESESINKTLIKDNEQKSSLETQIKNMNRYNPSNNKKFKEINTIIENIKNTNIKKETDLESKKNEIIKMNNEKNILKTDIQNIRNNITELENKIQENTNIKMEKIGTKQKEVDTKNSLYKKNKEDYNSWSSQYVNIFNNLKEYIKNNLTKYVKNEKIIKNGIEPFNLSYSYSYSNNKILLKLSPSINPSKNYYELIYDFKFTGALYNRNDQYSLNDDKYPLKIITTPEMIEINNKLDKFTRVLSLINDKYCIKYIIKIYPHLKDVIIETNGGSKFNKRKTRNNTRIMSSYKKRIVIENKRKSKRRNRKTRS